MSLFAELQSAAAEAQGHLADLTGGASNFVGPDGQTYTLVMRAANAFESEAVMHGYNDRAAIIATATRAQFSAPPIDWKRKKGTRLIPAPAVDAVIALVDDTDPLHYVFTLLVRQA